MNMADNDIPDNEVLDLDNKEVFYVCNACGDDGNDGNGGLCEYCHQWFCEEHLIIQPGHWLCAECLAVQGSVPSPTDNYTITALLDRISRLESILGTVRDALLIGSLSRAEIGHWVEEQMVKRLK